MQWHPSRKHTQKNAFSIPPLDLWIMYTSGHERKIYFSTGYNHLLSKCNPNSFRIDISVHFQKITHDHLLVIQKCLILRNEEVTVPIYSATNISLISLQIRYIWVAKMLPMASRSPYYALVALVFFDRVRDVNTTVVVTFRTRTLRLETCKCVPGMSPSNLHPLASVLSLTQIVTEAVKPVNDVLQHQRERTLLTYHRTVLRNTWEAFTLWKPSKDDRSYKLSSCGSKLPLEQIKTERIHAKQTKPN